ncbi:MAG: hypothetical protein RIR17_1884 [Planctomycetota bacterium]|mgnify:FL=1|jgi:hypothetical protein
MSAINLIAKLIALDPGYTISIGGGLEVSRLDKTTFSVVFPESSELDANIKEKRFKDAEAASEFFEAKRQSLKLGDDFLVEDEE